MPRFPPVTRTTRPDALVMMQNASGLAFGAVRAIQLTEFGGPETLVVREIDDPVAGDGEQVFRVRAAGVNYADTHQTEDSYLARQQLPMIPGGEVVVEDADGNRMLGLLGGGGYAELVAVPAGQMMPLPEGVDVVTAAAMPEVAATVWSNVFMIAGLQPGETLLVHGGAGGIGTFAIQAAAALGARVFTTAGSPEKRAFCEQLGAERAIDYREEDFVAVLKETGGANVVLDNMGAKYLARNIDALATEGRLVVIGMQGGTKAELDLNALLRKRGAVIATSLRARPVEGKSAICAAVVEHVWPLVAEGRLRPIVHEVMPLADVARAHALMEDSGHTGKILLTP